MRDKIDAVDACLSPNNTSVCFVRVCGVCFLAMCLTSRGHRTALVNSCAFFGSVTECRTSKLWAVADKD